MFTIHLDHLKAAVIAQASTTDAALSLVDQLAKELHQQLRRNGEGSRRFWATFLVADATTGRLQAFTSTNGHDGEPSQL